MRGSITVLGVLLFAAGPATRAPAQTATVVRSVNLRRDPSVTQPALRVLAPHERLTLVAAQPRNGFCQVRTADGLEGWVWVRNVRLTGTSPSPAATVPSALQPGPGVPGSTATVGCGDGLWQHVYHPQRLLVKLECVTVTGVLVDATATQARHEPDGVRHEPDGDMHGWLKVDPPFASLLNAGNMSDEGGNLVFEVVCHFPITQADAVPACMGFQDTTALPPVGTHVAITGTLVQDTKHARWNELHPVSKIRAQ